MLRWKPRVPVLATVRRRFSRGPAPVQGEDLHASLDALTGELKSIGEALTRHTEILRAIYEDEPGTRRRLWALRETPEYLRPFQEEDPLVTIFITTYSNVDGLRTRSIPSALAQTHENLEVLVVGDAASPDVAEVVASFDDPRVRFVNLPIRGPYPDEPVRFWHVAGTAPANEGLRLARGSWIAPNCDDDVFTPDHVEVLLADARRRRLELVYGRIRRLDPQGESILLGTFPPEVGNFGVQSALLHRGLRLFAHELLDAVFGDPGDFAWVRRMMRVGVKIGMVDNVVVDYYPSQLWGTPARPPGLLG